MGLGGIKTIRIKNIKGIEDLELSFEDLLIANRVNILVANNGFGKTSISKALNYLKEPQLVLKNDDFNDKTNGLPYIELEYAINNKWFKKHADFYENSIRKDLDFLVIDSPLKASATGTGAVLTTENINICKIYDKISYNYKLSDFLSENKLEVYSKVFKVVTYIDDNDLLLMIKDYKDYFNNESLNKKINSLFEKIDSSISKNKKQIFEYIEKENMLDIILSCNSGDKLFNLVKNYEMKNGYYSNDINTLFNFIQIYYLYNDKKKINDKIKYITSKNMRNYCVEILNKCNTIRKKVYEEHSNSKGKFLRLKLPKVTSISNGQRDLMCFVANFMQIVASGRSSRKMRVCVIDEIFDYLDGSNLLFVQYLISKYIRDFKNTSPTIFIIMTHLNPEIFNTFRLKNQKIYNIDTSNKANLKNDALKNILINRNNLSDDFKLAFESKFIHFNTDLNYDLNKFKEEEKVFCENNNDSSFFIAKMKKNLGDFLNNNSYEPLLLGCGLRYYCEKYQFSLLKTDELKNEYIQSHMTENKNNVLDKNNIEYDETVNILSLVYNEIAHINEKTFKSSVNKFILRVDSLVVRNIIKDFIKKYDLFN